MDAAEGASRSSTGKWVQVVHTGSDTLSMYSPEFYQKCFPELFPYGDGVYGLPRDTPLTFREWASYLLARVELEYEISDVATSDSLPETPFQPPIIPRWQADLNFLAVASDSWKRMEMVRLASGHVRGRNSKILCVLSWIVLLPNSAPLCVSLEIMRLCVM